MSTSAAYKQNVVGGKLKLKRPLGATSSGATAAHTTRRAAPTSTSSKPAPGSTETLQRAATEQAERKEQEASDGRPGDDERAGSGKRHKTEAVQPLDGKTKAEREFEEAQTRREADVIRAKISKSHRQAIEEYNAKLASLSEHHDIPRVGPG